MQYSDIKKMLNGADLIRPAHILVLLKQNATDAVRRLAKQKADSIYNVIQAGADFAEVAKTYGQTGEPVWISSANYEGAQIDGDNLKYIEAITTGKVKELVNLPLMQANIILQVTKAMVPKNIRRHCGKWDLVRYIEIHLLEDFWSKFDEIMQSKYAIDKNGVLA